MNTLKALKRCSLGLDLYLWLTYRTFPLHDPLPLTWRHLYSQFGTDPDKASDKQTVKVFRRQALRALKKIKLSWPGLNYSTAPGRPDPASLDTRDPSSNRGTAAHRIGRSRPSAHRQRTFRSGLDPFTPLHFSNRPVEGEHFH